MMTMIVTVTIQKKRRVGSVILGEKCDMVIVAILLGGVDKKYSVPIKNRYVAQLYSSLMLLCDSISL